MQNNNRANRQEVHMGLSQTYTPAPFELAQDQYAFDLWNNQGNNNDPYYRHLMNAFRVAVHNELTEQQRTYIMAYYYNRLTMKEIAKQFAVNKATVSRTIKRAEQRLQRALRYAHPRLLDHPEQSMKRKSTYNRSKQKKHRSNVE